MKAYSELYPSMYNYTKALNKQMNTPNSESVSDLATQRVNYKYFRKELADIKSEFTKEEKLLEEKVRNLNNFN